jgi:signal transduction histidine kinase
MSQSVRAAREAAESARHLAEAADRAKNEFLTMLGHELRNPLHAIALACQLLESPNNLKKARDIITRQSQHMTRLVEDLLDTAHVMSGGIVLSRKPLNMAELVAECIRGLRETGQMDRHAVETDFENVWIDGDSKRISQIVINLLSNAMKYTPPGGHIWVRARGGKEAVVQVQDNGIGISSEILSHVFELFARGEFGLQRSPAGLGIGLTLVQRLAELHGGRVEAASEGPGRGSTFTVTLPRINTRQARAEADGGPNKSIGPRGGFCSSRTTMMRERVCVCCLRGRATKYMQLAMVLPVWKRRWNSSQRSF